MDFDAVLLLSFGGPEGPEQVRPFLENVTRGRDIPPERLDEVAEHYLHFGGVSPINGINRALIAQLRRAGRWTLPVYFGNRNWEPYVEDTVAAMRDNGIRRAAVFTTSAWSGYSGCTQYVEDIARARRAAGPDAPELVKLRPLLRPPAVRRDVRRRHRRRSAHCREPARRRAAGVHRALDTGAPPTTRCGPKLYSRQVALRRKAGRGSRRIRRLRPGLAVAVGPAAGAVAGTRCGRPSRRARRSGHRRRSSSARSGSSPTTSRWCGTSTTSCANRPRPPGSRSPGRSTPNADPSVRPAGRGPDRRAPARPCARTGERTRPGARLRGRRQW